MTDPLSIIEEEATLPYLHAKVQAWAEQRNLVGPDSQPGKQLGKVREEVEELSDAYWEWDSYLPDNFDKPGAHEAYNAMLLELGDAFVTLIVLSRQLGTTASEALEAAHNKIKDREGATIDGVFVKSSDLVRQ